jgi:hypothetical protein
MYYGDLNNVAQKVNGFYYGDLNNIAQKVIKGYYGDSNGIARLFYDSSSSFIGYAMLYSDGTIVF